MAVPAERFQSGYLKQLAPSLSQTVQAVMDLGDLVNNQHCDSVVVNIMAYFSGARPHYLK